MSVEKIPGSARTFHLLSFGPDGEELPDPDGSSASERALADLIAPGADVTDVFVISHGWQTGRADAISDYGRWLAAADPDTAGDGIRPFVIGLHWPSKAFDDREPVSGGQGLLGGESAGVGVDDAVAAYAERLGVTDPDARDALRTVLTAAAATPSDATGSTADLGDDVARAYRTLAAVVGPTGRRAPAEDRALTEQWDAPKAAAAVAEESGSAAPDDDFVPPGLRDDPDEVRDDTEGPRDTSALLGVGEFFGRLRDILLSPLRQLSFWHMKDRGRRFGESGGRRLLESVMEAAPDARVHLMGHSFGCVVLSSAVRGPGKRPVPPPRPVDSLLLVQGAVSLWAFADRVPAAIGGGRGYLADVLRPEFVSGSIVATFSKWDYAVGRAYPLAVGLAGEYLLGERELPTFGGLGTWGIQGVPATEFTLAAGSDSSDRDFTPGVYNVAADAVINTLDGPSGAHSDLAHPELVWLGWRAALA